MLRTKAGRMRAYRSCSKTLSKIRFYTKNQATKTFFGRNTSGFEWIFPKGHTTPMENGLEK